MMFKTINELDFKGKKILMRIDLNSSISPLHRASQLDRTINGKVLESERFRRHADAIKQVMKKNPEKIVILAHQGRKGEEDFIDLKQHAAILNKYANVKFLPLLPGKEALRKIETIKEKAIMLDNVRFLDDETDINRKGNVIVDFAKNFDIFVQDAFSVCHRKNATTVLIPKIVQSCIGPNVEEELRNVEKLMNKSPLLLIVAGQKVEDYLPVTNMLEKNKRNKLLAAGYFDFLIRISQGFDYGLENRSLKNEMQFVNEVKKLYDRFTSQIILPVDYAVDENGKRKEIKLEEFPFEYKICDIGRKTIELFSREIGKAKAVFIKGALGCVEDRRFSDGTVSVLNAIAKSKDFSFISGGSISTAIQKYKLKGKFSYISLSGGALIAYLGGEELPGLEALKT